MTSERAAKAASNCRATLRLTPRSFGSLWEGFRNRFFSRSADARRAISLRTPDGRPPHHTFFWISVFRGFEVAFIRAAAGNAALSPRRSRQRGAVAALPGRAGATAAHDNAVGFRRPPRVHARVNGRRAPARPAIWPFRPNIVAYADIADSYATRKTRKKNDSETPPKRSKRAWGRAKGAEAIVGRFRGLLRQVLLKLCRHLTDPPGRISSPCWQNGPISAIMAGAEWAAKNSGRRSIDLEAGLVPKLAGRQSRRDGRV